MCLPWHLTHWSAQSGQKRLSSHHWPPEQKHPRQNKLKMMVLISHPTWYSFPSHMVLIAVHIPILHGSHCGIHSHGTHCGTHSHSYMRYTFPFLHAVHIPILHGTHCSTIFHPTCQLHRGHTCGRYLAFCSSVPNRRIPLNPMD